MLVWLCEDSGLLEEELLGLEVEGLLGWRSEDMEFGLDQVVLVWLLLGAGLLVLTDVEECVRLRSALGRALLLVGVIWLFSVRMLLGLMSVLFTFVWIAVLEGRGVGVGLFVGLFKGVLDSDPDPDPEGL